MSNDTLRDIVKAECDAIPLKRGGKFNIDAIKHARSRLGLDLKQAVEFVEAPAGKAPINFVAECSRLRSLNALLLEALRNIRREVNYLLDHARINADDAAHAARIESAEIAACAAIFEATKE